MTKSTHTEPAGGDNPWTSRRLLQWIHGHLEAQGVDSARVSAELLVGHSIRSERLRLYMEPDRVATPNELTTLRSLVARAARHEPVQYLVGSWPFFGREFEVAPCTLIPRPATETLVELALAELADRGLRRSWRILDLCTGGGCIAVSLAASLKSLRAGRVSDRVQPPACLAATPAIAEPLETPVIDLDQRVVPPVPPVEEVPDDSTTTDVPVGEVRIVATDLVEEALALAARNASRHEVEDLVECRLGSLFDPLEEGELGSFDLICANPPYVSNEEYENLDRNVRDYEPELALRGGPLGLDLIQPILEQSPRWLSENGLLLIEIGDPIHERVRALAGNVAGLCDVRVEQDHEGYYRVLVARAG